MVGPVFLNETGREPTGYGNYTARPIAVASDGVYALGVTTNQSVVHRVTMWADFNRDGVFSAAEQLNSGLTQAGTTPGPAFYSRDLFLGSYLPTPGPVRLRVLSTATDVVPDPCAQNIAGAEVEDYTLLISGNGLAAHPARPTLPALSVYPTPTLPDGQLHLVLADARAAGPYALTLENLLGARLLATTRRLGPAANATLDLSALPPGVYVLRLRDAQGREALRRVVRE